MRKFQITYSVPGTCDCCGGALAVPQGGAGSGTYTLEVPETATPTPVRIGQAVEVTLGGGKLVVRLRQARGSNRQWGVKPLYNPGAFTRQQKTGEHPEGSDFYFEVFTFDLPPFEPDIPTWWAELTFVETPWGARAQGGSLAEAHNKAAVRVRLVTLE